MPKSKKETAPQPKPTTEPKEEQAKRQLDSSVNWYEALQALEWKKHSEVLKQKLLPMHVVRFIIGTIFSQIRTSIAMSIESICESMLLTLFQAGIIQRGPNWDGFHSPHQIAEGFRFRICKCLGLEQDVAKMTDHWIVFGHGVWGQRRGPNREPYYIVYRYYRKLRIDNNWVLCVPDKKESLKLWEEVWQLASNEPCVKTELEKSPKEAADFKALAKKFARRTFLDEVKPLKKTPQIQHG